MSSASLSRWLLAARLRTLPLACSSVFLGSGLAAAAGGFDGGVFALRLDEVVPPALRPYNEVADAVEAKRCFDALADGGTVVMPLGKTFWSPSFGMLTDRYGVGWMINAMA